jgi:hypothetical protein
VTYNVLVICDHIVSAVGALREVHVPYIVALPRRGDYICGRVVSTDPAPESGVGVARGGTNSETHRSTGGIHIEILEETLVRVGTLAEIPYPARRAIVAVTHSVTIALDFCLFLNHTMENYTVTPRYDAK